MSSEASVVVLSPPGKFPFLKLPFELRSKIYQYWLSAKYVKKDLTEGKEDSVRTLRPLIFSL